MLKIKKIYLEVDIEYDSYNQRCDICHGHFKLPCEKCPDKKNCHEVYGKCGHAYHNHCIETWIKKKCICPFDNKYWQLKDN